MVEAIYILEMSGDRVLGVLYEDGRVVTFDSCDTQIISYSDDGYFPELRNEALKTFPKLIKIGGNMFKKWMNVDTSYKNAEKVMYVCSVDVIKRMRAIEKQLKQQKAMWQKLKEFIKTYQEDVVWKNKQVDEFQEEILDKMQELEGEDE